MEVPNFAVIKQINLYDIMKTKMKLIFCAVCIVAVASVFIPKRKTSVAESLQLINVEALANGESFDECRGLGSVDCPISSVKVYVVY